MDPTSSAAARTMRRYVAAVAGLWLACPFLSWLSPEWGAFRNWQVALNAILFIALARRPELLSAEGARVDRRWKVIAFAACVLWSFAGQLSHYFAFSVNGFDFSIFDWMLHSTHSGRFGYSPLYNLNHFGVHPSYILLPLVPWHAAFESPLALVVLTPAVVLAGALPLWKLGERYLPSDPWRILLVLAYVSSPWVNRLLDGGFRPEVFYPPLGLTLLWGWGENRPRIWIPAALLFLAIKEDAAVYLAALAVAAVWLEPRRRLQAGLLLAASVLVFAVNRGWAQPSFLEGSGWREPAYVQYWGQYGSTGRDIIWNMATSPVRLLRDMASSGWYLLFLPALLLPLLSPRAAVPMVPTLLLLGSSSNPTLHGFRSYYPAALLPFFFFGLALALDRLKALGVPARARDLWVLGALLLSPLVGGGYLRLYRPDLEALRGVRAAVQRLSSDDVPVCVQPVLYPHLPYWTRLHSLTPECLHAPGAELLVAPRLDPFPHGTEELDAEVARHARLGLAEELSPGFFLLHRTGPGETAP